MNLRERGKARICKDESVNIQMRSSVEVTPLLVWFSNIMGQWMLYWLPRIRYWSAVGGKKKNRIWKGIKCLIICKTEVTEKPEIKGSHWKLEDGTHFSSILQIQKCHLDISLQDFLTLLKWNRTSTYSGKPWYGWSFACRVIWFGSRQAYSLNHSGVWWRQGGRNEHTHGKKMDSVLLMATSKWTYHSSIKIAIALKDLNEAE